MTEKSPNLLRELFSLSSVDGSIAHIALERKKYERELEELKKSVKANSDLLTAKKDALTKKKDQVTKEEKSIKEENEKLNARRNALSTLTNYKLQQGAEREIDHAAKLVEEREEALLNVMQEIETAENEVAKLNGILTDKKTSYETLALEIADIFMNLEDRNSRYMRERDEIASKIQKTDLTVYDRVKEKHPADPVVSIQNSACSGCFMQVPPQMAVIVSKGDTISKCRGCARILYSPPSKD